jgi:hypothetical protein
LEIINKTLLVDNGGKFIIFRQRVSCDKAVERKIDERLKVGKKKIGFGNQGDSRKSY